MLTFFRSFFNSRLGVVITLAFVGLIGIAFALGDVAGTSFGSFSSGSKIASVGSAKISSSDLETQFRGIVARLRQRNPQLSIKEFLAQDGLNEVLTYAMDGKAVIQWGEKYGLYVGDRLIDSEIAKDPNLQTPDGKVERALPPDAGLAGDHRRHLPHRANPSPDGKALADLQLAGTQIAAQGDQPLHRGAD